VGKNSFILKFWRFISIYTQSKGGSGYQYGESVTIAINGLALPAFCDLKFSNFTHCYVTDTHYLNTNHIYNFTYLNITGSLSLGASSNLTFFMPI
jgi:hypothetical protein